MFSDGGLGLNLKENNATGNVIRGNFIGIEADGKTSFRGNSNGIDLLRAPNNTIGGTAAGAGNVISGCGGHAINAVDSDGLVIQGNLIGTNAAGTAELANNGGVTIAGSSNCVVGGTASGARNVISANAGNGIRFSLSAGTAGNRIQGNYIGTDITGTKPLGNGGSGLQLFAFAEPLNANAITVGGTTAAARNIISASGGNGVLLQSSHILIQGNYIGTDVQGTGALGNAASGIFVQTGNNTIGGTGSGAGNLIAFNGINNAGITNNSGLYFVSSAAGVSVLGNSIFRNTGLGIDLPSTAENSLQVNPNDAGDTDTGANNLQNYPVLKSTSITSGTVNVTGTLNSAANTTFRLEFFGNDTIDASGFGEGRYFLGFANVTTNASGNASFNLNFPTGPGARHITATATDPAGNTSEFSAALGQLLNISTRLRVQTGENVLIAGFIIVGPDPKRVIVRGLGPSLPVEDPLLDPTLELHDSDGALLASNDNWKDSQQAAIQASGIPPSDARESAIVRTLPTNNAAYTAVVRGNGNTQGSAVVEAYDLDAENQSTLANISTRGLVEGGNNLLIGGFITGNGRTRVIVRALGPSLSAAGVSRPLPDPTLELHDGNGALLASNDNWRSSQEAEIMTTGIAPKSNLESAIIAIAPPAPYTAVVRDAAGRTGIALVEVYAIN